MELPVWSIAAFLGAVGATITGLFIRAGVLARARDAEFVAPKEAVHVPVRFRGAPDLAHAARCWNGAVNALALHGPWTRDVLLARLKAGVKVQVMPEAVWNGLSGQKVGGELIGDIIHAGPSLDVLCHELAHLAEQVIDGYPDEAHLRWASRGITAADNTYRAFVAKL